MKTLKLLIEAADNAIEANGFDEISKRLNEIKELFRTRLDEGFMDNHNGELDRKFDELEAKLIAARRKLGELNTSDMPHEQKAAAKAQVMRDINVFRNSLYDVMLDLGMKEKEIKYHLDRIALDRQYGKPAERFTNVNKDEAKQKFAEFMNNRRNFAKPEDIGDMVAPKNKTDNRKWYQKLFGR